MSKKVGGLISTEQYYPTPNVYSNPLADPSQNITSTNIYNKPLYHGVPGTAGPLQVGFASANSGVNWSIAIWIAGAVAIVAYMKRDALKRMLT